MGMDNEELPRNISFETNRVNRAINQNKYEKNNYYDMVNNYNHLTVTQKSVLTNIFKKYKDLFSSKLGKVPGPPIDLKTFCVAAYPTSQIRNQPTRRYRCIDPRCRYCMEVPIFSAKRSTVRYDLFPILEN